ncbi:MAG: dTDP-4-dehydrorhamnose reductase [Candidatus Aminicenantes bacterium]|nr:dTDP-4-dehydrorhamnose reductase [Candidatus Aminicenantes bacterium]
MSAANGIWLLGDRGMLGRQIVVELQKSGIAFAASDREVDISDWPSLKAFSSGKKISWIINCAAYTAVDQAEIDSAAAFRVNAAGVENLAKLAAGLGAKLVHFSTDYVFDGRARRPYLESDPPRPLSQYGQSKWQGEKLLTANCPSAFIFRISWLYGVFGNNFVNTMLRIFREKEVARMVNDQFGSPTYAAALAGNIVRLIESGSERYGLYHYCYGGVIPWFDFAACIMDLALKSGWIEKKIPLLAVSTSEFPTRAARPLRAVLDNGKVVRELGFRVVDWQLNLKDFFREKALLEKSQP